MTRALCMVVLVSIVGCGRAHETGDPVGDTTPGIGDALGIALPIADGRNEGYGPGVFADLDGDGIDDIVLVNGINRDDTTPYRGSGLGILYGRRDRTPPRLEELVEILGPTHQASSAWVARGDYDGDGIDDLAFGVPAVPPDFGSLHVIYGSRTRLVGRSFIENVAPPIAVGGLHFSPVTFPTRGACAGDVDGDGRDDLLIGHQEVTGATGEIQLYLATAARWPDAPITADATFTLPPLRIPYVTTGGDLDGDHHVDVVVADGAPDSSGLRVDVFYGPIARGTHALDDAAAHVATPVAFLRGGYDADGDGLVDLAVADGTPIPGGPPLSGGSLRVFTGSASRLTGDVALASAPILFMPDSESDGLGTSFAVGDTTGDGVPDVVVGMPYAHDRGGRVALLFGPLRSRLVNDAERTWDGATGTHPQTIGFESAVGDFDGDGLDDVLFGGPLPSANGEHGAAYLAWGMSRP